MPLYAVIALKNSAPVIDQAVRSNFPSDTYQIEPGKWIVKTDVPTAKDLSTKLGLVQAHVHLILPIRGYFGRAQPDLWEWLATQSEKANG